MKLHRKLILLAMASAILTLTSVRAQQTTSSTSGVPHSMKFSGVAKDSSDRVISGSVGITFALYAEQDGGSPLWLETQNVNADASGHYTVQLGATKLNGIPVGLFTTAEARWLGVSTNGAAEAPRIMLMSVPYALKAADAETVGGLPPSAFVLAAPAGPSANANSASTSTVTGPTIGGGGTQNFVPLWTDNAGTLGNSVLFQSGSGSTAKIGLNTTSPASTLDVKGSSTIRGTLSLPATGAATSASGKNSQPLNVTASAFNSSTGTAVNQNFRWQAEPLGNNTASTSGTLSLLYASGTNPPAETGFRIGNNGQLTFAPGQTFPGTGTITGVTASIGGGLSGGGTSGNVSLSLIKSCTNGQVLKWTGSSWGCSTAPSGTVTSVGLSAPPSDFSVSGSPITGAGTLGLAWTIAPTSTNTSNSIVKRDAVGGFSAGTIAATSFAGSGSALTNVNAASLNGLPSTSFSQLAQSNTYRSATPGTVVPQVMGSVNTATASVGANSNPLDLAASAFNSSSAAAQAETFRWQAEPSGNNTSSPSGSLNLLFGSGNSTPSETGFKIGNNGQVTFPSGQFFPNTLSTLSATSPLTATTTSNGAASVQLSGCASSGQVLEWTGSPAVWTCVTPITNITAGTDLTGGGGSGNLTLSLNTSATDARYAQLAAANTFMSSQTILGNFSVGNGATSVITQTYGKDASGVGVQNTVTNTSTSGASYAVLAATSSTGVTAELVADGLGVGPLGSAGGYIGTFTNQPFGFTTNNTARMVIMANGNIGIGTSAPSASLQVVPPASSGVTALSSTGGSSNSSFLTPGLGLYTVGGLNSTNGGVGGAGVYSVGGAETGIYDSNFNLPYGGDGVQGFGGDGLARGNGGNGAYFIGGNGGTTEGLGGDGVFAEGGSPSGSAVVAVADAGGFDGIDAYAGSGLAGFFIGDVWITGNLMKSSGSFKIDHPLDPANKYLSHSFVESPDMKNIYDGVVVLDDSGEASVDMPEWFGALNRDFRYQLTCIGGFAPIYIAEEITNNSFRIAGGKPGMKVSWQVTGTRHDVWANAHRIPVEEDKSSAELGFYLAPELFGAPPEKSIDRVRRPEVREYTKRRHSHTVNRVNADHDQKTVHTTQE
jgi:hypothetical protein